jgi:hypothetical protein
MYYNGGHLVNCLIFFVVFFVLVKVFGIHILAIILFVS